MTFRGNSVTAGILGCMAVFVAASLQSCSFQPNSWNGLCQAYRDIPAIPLTGQTSRTIFETPGTVIAIHGSGGAAHVASDGAGYSGAAIKVEQGVVIPDYADRALVFLNGWKLNYAGDDHHVRTFGTVITEIKVDPTLHNITWDALGSIQDDSFTESFNWSYQFTVIAWNSQNLNAFVDQGAGNRARFLNCTPLQSQIPDNYFYADNASSSNNSNSGMTSALTSFLTFLRNAAFGSGTTAVLPRGFGFVWNDGDHHLFQVAYNLGQSETVAQNATYYQHGQRISAPLPNPPVSHVDSGFVSWSPYAIFSDNDTRRDYTFAEVASGVGGSDVGLIQPPYSILPVASQAGIFDGCAPIGGPTYTTDDRTIENIPYQFAIPVLTGWNLRYLCSDHHVRDVGVWIDDWSYQPPSGGSGGVLHYKLSYTLRDNDATRAMLADYEVSVLGLRGVAVGNNVKGTETATGPAAAHAPLIPAHH